MSIYFSNDRDNELDRVTRRSMHDSEDHANRFWFAMLAIITAFCLGFFFGNIMHDKAFHPIEIGYTK